MVGVLAHYGCRLIIQVVVVDEIPPFYVKRIEYPEKRYINVTNYYYYQFKQNKKHWSKRLSVCTFKSSSKKAILLLPH